MRLYLLPLGYALFLWWASTALIIMLYRLPRRTHRLSFGAITALGLLALWGIVATRADTSLAGAYCAFSCGTLIWGWQLAGLYMGGVTGPRRIGCPPDSTTWQRFHYGIAAFLYHELAVHIALAVVAAVTHDSANRLALWTLVALWLMHQSAKLTVFFGVQNFDVRFFPQHLRYIASYSVRRTMNAFFPPAVTIISIVTMLLLGRSLTAVTEFETVSCLFLGFLMALGVLEHGLLMLPPLPMLAPLTSRLLTVLKLPSLVPLTARLFAMLEHYQQQMMDDRSFTTDR